MKIVDHDVNKKVFVIAEIGNNHEGDFELAKKMVHLAADAKADAVKFQTIVPEKLVSQQQSERVAQLKRFQFSYDQFTELAKVAEECGLMFLSTPFDLESVAHLQSLVPAYKISSGDNNFFPLLQVVAHTGKPLIISTGLTTLEDIARLVSFVKNIWKNKGITQEMALLHCVVNYPTSLEEANLQVIEDLKEFDVVPGYSDHTLGIEAVKAAVAMGARVIEKHFTISKTHSDFRDHQLSADPEEFTELVKAIRTIEKMKGQGRVNLPDNEKDILPLVRRSIVAKECLGSGHVLRLEDLYWVRPGQGLSPGYEKELLGKTLVRAVAAGEMILLEDVK